MDNWEKAQKEARRMAMAAYNGVWSWRDHPSFNDKAALLTEIDKAMGALDLIGWVTGDYTDPRRGMLVDLRAAVKAQRRDAYMDLPPLSKYGL